MSNRKLVNLAIVSIITLLAVALVSLIVQGTTEEAKHWQKASAPKTDSGVTACKNMAKEANNRVTGDTKPLSKEDALVAKTPFLTSKHDDIRHAGTTIIDTIYNANVAVEKGDLGSSLTLLSDIQSQWGELRLACANHGVKVPPLKTS
jgi:hypothetical protein